MKCSFYDFLASKQKTNAFFNSDQMDFYLTNRYLLTPYENLRIFLDSNEPFQIIRANILLRSLLNKKAIEKLYFNKKKKNEDATLSVNEYMEMGMSELPYLIYNQEKIYIPLFTNLLNKIYTQDFSKLNKKPYNNLLNNFEPFIIDCFDYYGEALYDSYFTKLVKIMSFCGNSAFFDYDADTLYFINKGGRIDAKIALFDKYLEKINKSHMVNRLNNVAKSYYYGDKEELINSLVDNQFISAELINKYKKKVTKK